MKYAILIFVLAVPQMLFSQQPYVQKENEELYAIMKQDLVFLTRFCEVIAKSLAAYIR